MGIKDVADMRPSEIAAHLNALEKAIEWISDQEQEIGDLRKEVNHLRLMIGYPPKKFPRKDGG